MAKNAKRKTWLLVSVFMIVALLLAACSGKGSEPQNTASSPPATNHSQGNTEAEKEPVELTLFVDHTWFWVDKFEGEIPEEITKRTGVTLKIIKASESNQLPVLIASGDMPDLVYTQRLEDRLANPDISYAWDELIAQYAPDFVIDPIEIANNTVDDGHFYTIKNAFATEEQWNSNKYAMPSPGTPSLTVRADILQALGNPAINTLDDYVQVLGMVKEQYPDMIPLVLGEATWATNYFASEFGVDAGASNVYERDGNIHYRMTHPGMKEMYLFLNKLYRNGYLTAENFAYEHQQFMEQLNTGKAFSFTRATTDGTTATNNLKQGGIDGSFEVLTKPLSDQAVLLDDAIGWSGVYITKKNKNPERAIQFMQFMKSEEGQRLQTWGIEGEHWTMSPEGYPILTAEYAEAKVNDYDGFIRKYGTGAWTFGMSAVTEGLFNYDPDNAIITERYLEAKKIKVYRPDLYFVRPPADSDERNIYNQLAELVKSEQVRIILANSEADAVKAYEEMLGKAESIGMSKLEAWMTAKYAEVKKRYN